MTLQEARYLALHVDGAFADHERRLAFNILDNASEGAAPDKLRKEYRELAQKIWDYFG